MLHEINLTQPALHGSIAAVGFSVAHFASSFSEGVRFTFLLLGIIFVSTMMVEVFWYSAYHAERVYQSHKQAEATTPELLLVQNVRFLNPTQLEFALGAQKQLKIRNIPGTDGPVQFYLCGDLEVPRSLVKDFFDNCDSNTLVPIREYSDSEARQFAVALTDTLVGHGLAIRGSGNQRSTWVHSLETARKYFGV